VLPFWPNLIVLSLFTLKYLIFTITTDIHVMYCSYYVLLTKSVNMVLLQIYKYISFKYNVMVALMLKLCVDIGHKYIYLFDIRLNLHN